MSVLVWVFVQDSRINDILKFEVNVYVSKKKIIISSELAPGRY